MPTSNGVPFPDAAPAYAQATAQCRGVKTLSAELALSGRVGGTRVRGRILGGFAEPGRVRLEAPAPFGRAVFTLVIKDDGATLVLDRERRVLADAPPAALLEALAGVALGPDDLRSALAGCGLNLGPDTAASGTAFGSDWVMVEGASARSWLRRTNAGWRLAASTRGRVEIRYSEFLSGRPGAVRVRSSAGQPDESDLTLRLSQVDINVPLGADVFQLEIPPDASPLTLDELRRNGPFAGRDEDEDAGGEAPRAMRHLQ